MFVYIRFFFSSWPSSPFSSLPAFQRRSWNTIEGMPKMKTNHLDAPPNILLFRPPFCAFHCFLSFRVPLLFDPLLSHTVLISCSILSVLFLCLPVCMPLSQALILNVLALARPFGHGTIAMDYSTIQHLLRSISLSVASFCQRQS